MPVPDQVRDDGSGIQYLSNLLWIPDQARNDGVSRKDGVGLSKVSKVFTNFFKPALSEAWVDASVRYSESPKPLLELTLVPVGADIDKKHMLS
jgi:hypothetical protein